MRRAFSELIGECQVLPWAPSTGDARTNANELAARVFDLPRTEPLLVIGVSVGAHAVAWWAQASPRPRTRLVLALPAWTGEPDDVAAVTAATAKRIAAHGVRAELAALERDFPGDWVAEELVRAWGALPRDLLVSTLQQTAASPAPTGPQLRRIKAETLVVGLHDDPLHPWTVAQQWAEAIPSATLIGLDRGQPQSDIAIFGRRCAQVWAERSALASGKQT